HPVRDAEPGVAPLQVLRHRARAEPQPRRHLRVGESRSDRSAKARTRRRSAPGTSVGTRTQEAPARAVIPLGGATCRGDKVATTVFRRVAGTRETRETEEG